MYLNDFKVGDVDYLKSIPFENIQVRFLSENETEPVRADGWTESRSS